MRVATFEQQLQTIMTIAETLVHTHLNHERRNDRLKALQAIIDNYMQGIERGAWDGDKLYQLTILRTCYEMAIWRLEYETHSCVKTRLRLLVEACENALGVLRRKEDEMRTTIRHMTAVAEGDSYDAPPADMDDVPF